MELRQVRILLIPTKEQRQAFYASAYYSNRMYNEALQWNIDYYNDTGKFYSFFEMVNLVTDFRKNNKDFQSVNCGVLTASVKNLRAAFDNMKSGRRFPRFKKAGKKLSFGFNKNALKVKHNQVRIPSIGWVYCKHCHWLTRNKSDDELVELKYYYGFHNPHIKFDGKYWFLVFGVEIDLTPDTTTEKIIGVDIGIKNTIYTSNGIKKPNINRTRKIINLEKRKKRLQRKVSRKYELNKDGKKYIKTKNIKRLEKQIRLIDRRLHNIRDNYNQTITNEIIAQHPTLIMIEDLKVRNMMKNRYLAKSIQEQQFYRIRQLLIEKAKNTISTKVGVVPWNYPSSKMCSQCGFIKKDLKLSDRTYICPQCGLILDRDYNAAINIRDCSTYKLAF